MVSNSSYRKSFIDSSRTTARHYGFDCLDFYWICPETSSDMFNLSTLYQEWRLAVSFGARNSSKSQLILTTVILNIKGWIGAGLSANKLVICLPFYGYAWKLVNSMDSVNYCTIGTSWIGFDDVEAIRAKVSYAKEKGLLGYHVWTVSYDDNWVLSQASAQEANINSSAHQDRDGRSRQNKQSYPIFLVIVLPTTAAAMLLLLVLGLVIYFGWMRKLKSKGNQ
ncbi:hypothetical protein QYF36_020161 [Acer negundo]|nr:hypothetical protein QYF36_020161 [Acer negundo]